MFLGDGVDPLHLESGRSLNLRLIGECRRICCFGKQRLPPRICAIGCHAHCQLEVPGAGFRSEPVRPGFDQLWRTLSDEAGRQCRDEAGQRAVVLGCHADFVFTWFEKFRDILQGGLVLVEVHSGLFPIDPCGGSVVAGEMEACRGHIAVEGEFFHKRHLFPSGGVRGGPDPDRIRMDAGDGRHEDDEGSEIHDGIRAVES